MAVAPAVRPRRDFAQLVFLNRVLQVFSQLRALADVQHIKNRLLAQEHESAKALFIFRRHFHFAQRTFGFDLCFGALEQLEFFFQIGGAHLLQIFFHALNAFFNLAEIADHQIEFDVLNIAQRINRSGVRNGVVLESPHYVRDCVHIAKMGDVAGFFQRVLADGAEINVFNRGVRQFLGIALRGQAIETIVGNFGDADVGFARIGAAG